jgi:hypothetical protein
VKRREKIRKEETTREILIILEFKKLQLKDDNKIKRYCKVCKERG